MDSFTRARGPDDDWPLTLKAADDTLDNERFVFLLMLVTVPLGSVYILSEAADAISVAITAVVALLLLGMPVWIMGYALRIWWRRSRGMPDLVLDDRGVHGAFLAVRGGRLTWEDILDTATFRLPGPHYGEPLVLLQLREGVVRSWDARLQATEGVHFRREVSLSPDLFGLGSAELERLLRREIRSTDRPAADRGRPSAPVSSLTKRAARLGDYIAAVRRGETVEFRATPLRRGTFGCVMIPLLAVLTAGIVGGPFAWYWLIGSGDSEFWVPMVVTVVLALTVGPLIAYAFYQQCRRAPAVLLGRPVWRLSPEGLADPSGVFLKATVPWQAVYSASVFMAPRSGDNLRLHGDRLYRYTAGISSPNSLLQGSLSTTESIAIQHQDTPLTSLELRDLIEVCIVEWGRRAH